MTLTTPRAILFDWDNTLVNTWPVIHFALNQTMRGMGAEEWSMEKVRANVKRSMRDSFPELFGDRWEDAAHIYTQSYKSVHLERLEALEGAETVLQFLQSAPLFRGIVSNKRGPSLRQEVAHLSWGDYFHVQVGADDATHDKPNPAPVLHALQGTDIFPASDVWFIGDSSIDLECAKNTGCTPILYGPHTTQNGSYDGFAFAYHARNHDDLLQLCKQHLGV
jgi:phosphoglycolate phosphatase